MRPVAAKASRASRDFDRATEGEDRSRWGDGRNRAIDSGSAAWPERELRKPDGIAYRRPEAAERNLSAWRLAGPHGDSRGPAVAGHRGVPGGPRGVLPGDRRRHLPHFLHDA